MSLIVLVLLLLVYLLAGMVLYVIFKFDLDVETRDVWIGIFTWPFWGAKQLWFAFCDRVLADRNP